MAMLIYEQGNSIIVPLEIKLGKLNELEDVVKRLRKAGGDLPAGSLPKTPGISDEGHGGSMKRKKGEANLGVYGADESIEKGIKKFMDKTVGNSASDAVGNFSLLVKNPQGFIMRLLMNPVTASLLVGVIGAAMVYELLTTYGGVFDLHFKRVVVDENIKGRSREQKEAIRVGLGDSVVITSHSGSTQPADAFNSFETVRSGEMRNIKSFQIRKGYRY